MKGIRTFAMAALLAATWAAGIAPAQAQQPRVLKFASIQSAAQPSSKGMERMAQIVAERTNGALKLQLYPDGALGTEQESTEGVQFGTIDMYMGSSGAVGRFLPSLEAFSSPYIWRDVDHMMKVVRGPIGEELNQDMIAKTGIRVLDMGWFFGARHIATKDFAVSKPADLKGRKIRMQPTAIYVDAMTAMGANVIPMDFKEVYTGLQTGVISGLDNPANVYAARSMWEVINNVSLTGHILQNQVVIINEKLFQSFSPEWRKIIRRCRAGSGRLPDRSHDQGRPGRARPARESRRQGHQARHRGVPGSDGGRPQEVREQVETRLVRAHREHALER